MAEQILSRLITAIQLVRGIGRGRNAEICNKTGYSPSHVSGVMNGKVALDDKFIRAVCREYSISEKWVIFGEGEVIAVPEEYPHGIDKFKQAAAQAATISKVKRSTVRSCSAPPKKQGVRQFA